MNGSRISSSPQSQEVIRTMGIVPPAPPQNHTIEQPRRAAALEKETIPVALPIQVARPIASNEELPEASCVEKEKVDAVIKIQCATRTYLEKKEIESQRKHAVIKIQCASRTYLAKKEIESQRSVLKIQYAYRTYIANKEIKLQRSALKIQSLHRENRVRRQIEIDNVISTLKKGLTSEEDANEISKRLYKSLENGNLDLSNLKISDEILSQILPLLSVLNIKELDLVGNNIGPKGAIVLADALKINTSLTHLNLGCNNIGDEGSTALAEALKINTSLEKLHLRGNILRNDGALALAEALEINKSLTDLDLSWTKLGPEGTTALAEALKINTSLTYIDLYGNKLRDDLKKAIDKELKINKEIAEFKKEYKEQYMLKFLYLNKINSFMGQMVAEFIIDDFINPEAYQKLQTISERKQHQPNPLAAEQDPNPSTGKN